MWLDVSSNASACVMQTQHCTVQQDDLWQLVPGFCDNKDNSKLTSSICGSRPVEQIHGRHLKHICLQG